jgi:hypothetical protein
MRQERSIRLADLDERAQQAIEELERTIAAQFPGTTFVLAHSPDDQASIHLLAIADVDDPADIGVLVSEASAPPGVVAKPRARSIIAVDQLPHDIGDDPGTRLP